jgi:Xaa-Pro aminopeptidase
MVYDIFNRVFCMVNLRAEILRRRRTLSGGSCMGISRTEYERRYAAIRELMKRDGIDCILVVGQGDDFNRGNIRYVTGSGRGGCCIFPAEGKPVFLQGPGQSASPKIKQTVEAYRLLDLRETDNPAEQVKIELARSCGGNRVGIVGQNCISVPMYRAVTENYGEKLADATGIFEEMREVKSDEEISKMRQAAAVADSVYSTLREIIRPGLSDWEIYGQVKKTVYEMGCEYSFDLIDASGSRLNMTFAPTGERLKADNTLFMEITPAYEGYYAQLPVTLPVGRYPPTLRKMAGIWEQADKKARQILKPGTKVSEVYAALVNTVKESGYISPLRPGHSIGLDALDFWSITETSTKTLRAGMTLAVHPSIMTAPGGDACGLGYTYLITESGSERFSRVDLTELRRE